MPSVESERIGPEAKLSEEQRKKRKERLERRKESASKYILKWWKGDAHMHSKESTREGFGYPEGVYDIEESMEYYKKLGLEFLCFAEHASNPGSPEKQPEDSRICQSLLTETEKVTKINKERKGGPVALSGVETSLLFDENNEPALDVPSKVLEKLDIVIASRHAIAKEKEPEIIKQTLLFAAKHPDVDVIGHPDRYTRIDNEKSAKYWREYWSIWPEILQEMEKNNKAFEINLNNPPSKKLVKMAVGAGVRFFINYDAHDFGQYKKEKSEIVKAGEEAKKKWAKEEATEEDLETLKKYKQERLASGPGLEALLRLYNWIKTLESLGAKPDDVVNSSKENLLDFLTKSRGKLTKNLKNLRAE